MPAGVVRLLAKGTPDPIRPAPGRTLLEHTLRALDAATALLNACDRDVVRSLGLDEPAWREPLRRATLLASFLHDLGKANDHFQAMVRRRPDQPGSRQAHRHELLSFWLACDDGPLGEWLFDGAASEVRCATLCAVAGHHLKIESDAVFRYAKDSQHDRLVLLAGHPDFVQTLQHGAVRLRLAAPPAVEEAAFDAYDRELFDAIRPTLRRLRRDIDGPSDGLARRFVGTVKALTLASDVIASAETRGGASRREIIGVLGDMLVRGCTGEDLRKVAEARLGGMPARPFQEQAAAATASVALVRAGCGSGKTVAAYLWAGERINGRKLFVCYPTTGTATEGFRDYVREAELDAILYHSRAEVDIEFMDSGEARHDNARDEALDEWAAYRALQLWSEQVTVCTADTVLGLLQNYRGGLVAFPALTRAIYVFDEIHLFDDRMFSALCRFIEEFPGTPMLLMTASLQVGRLAAVRQAVTARRETLEEIAGPAELELGPRYTLACTEMDMAMEHAAGALARGGKVLWVCNTVDAAVRAAERFAAAVATPLVYHSRFRYEDRAKRHREVIDTFDAQRNPGPALAVTTQVCEVSLDLSADLLVSEIAPPPAMIQRLGRLNRRFDPATPETRPALFLEPASSLPYEATDLDLGRAWLSRLGDGPCSQRDLAQAFEALDTTDHDDEPVSHVWLDAVPLAWPAPLREPEPSISILLPADVPHCTHGPRRPIPKEIARRAIPMTLGPVRDEFRSWQRLGMAFVAPAGRVSYSVRTGARWTEEGSP